MRDYQKYTIDGDAYQGNGNGYHGNGYDRLDGDYAPFYKVANGFTNKVKREDREDLLHDLFLAFATVKASYTAKGKELTEGGLVRIAQYELSDYWRKHFKRINGIDCGCCSKAQRGKCREKDLYGECPKAVKRESLDRIVENGNGASVPLYELIADDNADFTPRLEAKLILENYPKRFVQLAYKRYAGYSLDNADRVYYYKQLKKAQKPLAI
jgi:hypothetical protein